MKAASFLLPAGPPAVLSMLSWLPSVICFRSSLYYFCTPFFHSPSFPFISSTQFCDFLSSFLFLFFFSCSLPPQFPKKLLPKLRKPSVGLCSCCFTVSAPLLLYSVSRLQIYSVKNYRGLISNHQSLLSR